VTAKQPAVKKFVVRLDDDERERLSTLIKKGKAPARQLLKARILLKADAPETGEAWGDSRIAEALAAASLPMKPGHVERREFEYVRHDAQALIAAFDVATGQVCGTRRQSHGDGLCGVPRTAVCHWLVAPGLAARRRTFHSAPGIRMRRPMRSSAWTGWLSG
jgi:hypothetical protein